MTLGSLVARSAWGRAILLTLSAAAVALVPMRAEAMPPRPGVALPDSSGKAGGSYVDVKVRRITEVRPISTTAPAPLTALKGEHRLLVVLVETADSPWPDAHQPERFRRLIFDKSTSSMREYYRENSYGLFDLTGEVVGPVRVPGRMEDYRYQQQAPQGDRVAKLIKAAVEAAARKTKLAAFDAFDAQGRGGKDGILDHLMILYAEKSGVPDGFNPIWPHRGSIDFEVQGVKVASYTILNHAARLGVYVHEFGHDIGLPDLYDRDYSSHGAGDWCTMASGSWAGDAQQPVHISAWAKIRLGWITPEVIAKPVPNLRVPSSSERPFALKIPIGEVDSNEFFVVENRRRVGFDAKVPAEGLVIWHVDESKGNNDDERRKMVDVVEATRVQDLDRRDERAQPGYLEDVFSGKGRDTFSDDTEPSARGNDGRPSKIRLKVLTPPERVMSVDIDRPEIFNPGGVPFEISRDGYTFGRFMTVPLGAGAEALMQLDATPGGYLVFGANVFFGGNPGARGKVKVRLYRDERGAPGKVLVERSANVAIGADGFTWESVRMAEGSRGVELAAGQKVWVGVVSGDGQVLPAMNPFSTTQSARYRRPKKKGLERSFRFKGQGETAVPDYIIRLSGFGYLKGPDRPEALANEDDELVVRLKKADALADAKRHEDALASYREILAAMEKDARRYASWIPVAINSVGVEAYELGRYDEAITQFEASLRQAEAAKDLPNMADIYENLGETHFFAKRSDQAAIYCERSRRLNEHLERIDRLVENLYWIGRTHQVGGRSAKAEDSFTKALAAAERAFEKDAASEAEWRSRIEKAIGGAPEDEGGVRQRVEDSTDERKSKKTQKAVYTDLLQFLVDDTAEGESK